MAALRAEHDAAVALAARGGPALLDCKPALAESVTLARASAAPLNALHLELLGRRRGGDESDEVRLAIQLTWRAWRRR